MLWFPDSDGNIPLTQSTFCNSAIFLSDTILCLEEGCHPDTRKMKVLHGIDGAGS